MTFNEDSRVKIPALVHLTRLGYTYVSLKHEKWDRDTNIFPELFSEAILKINPDIPPPLVHGLKREISLLLENEDLGRAFYERLIQPHGLRLIDFENFDNNSFHVVTELPCINGNEEFRPDITLLINGIPLVFIEVKKPNNRDGILADTNLHALHHSPEYATNLDPDTPTNRLSSSLFCRERLCFLLRYGIAYVRKEHGFEKHIMRYPQLFASRAIDRTLERGIKKGIIWHTQGSGKTALAFYNVRFLTDRLQARGVIPKFYFIVDRIDLLVQASREFAGRGLIVHPIDSREQFAKDIKSNRAVHNHAGKHEITVVNIQKFQDDPDVTRARDYDLSLQRIYFLDEVHRSYNPKGSFLANLEESDPNAIKIGLTGTPLLGSDHNSRALFGDYIHKYYYNASIADGYTLRLLREEIATEYKLTLQQTLEQIQVLQGRENRETVYAHENFVRPMLNYILNDFEKARRTHNEPDIGALVICDSAAQARKMAELFSALHPAKPDSQPIPFPSLDPALDLAADNPNPDYRQRPRDFAPKTAALILHDAGTKDERDELIEDFKAGRIDLLFVYNMLLTGFDAPRLKKLYLGRLIRAHNLLQALTRVNRTYKNFRYGYVVDFADIQAEFDKTNKAYFDELQSELGDELENYSNLFKSVEEIEAEIEQIQDALFHFNLDNAEEFSRQISQIKERGHMLEVVRALDNARDLYNVIRQAGHYDLLDRLDFRQLTTLRTEARNHLALINQ
ncbi:MAG: type I restriction endonuclease, partial [Kiritimatiellia bacterium]